ncbi:DUF2891 domain-containing protein [Filimonas effusa]|uniref:DUF2891 domain-containing protein n=1 Tax=Filimonas effusa TaxID=2508721 RepID=A0A4Q1D0B6_9BACT|nr:DUF2891 domain-containing protein [Filimonas effusa]RXK81036.1 DUF2891 domain-containing protein [Filimonas effusa]
MKKCFFICCILVTPFLITAQSVTGLFTVNSDSTAFTLTPQGAAHLASLPLKCLQQEYPNKTSHTSMKEADHKLTPSQLHPAFFGCFDWHSSVHGHWMLVRLLKQFKNIGGEDRIRQALNTNLQYDKMEKEAAYFQGMISNTWERTYGWAWLLKLDAELITWNDPQGKLWHENLQPLVTRIAELWKVYLPKETYPNRTGVHPNTAFGLVFALDYAQAAKDTAFEWALKKHAKQLFLKDKNAPASWEPNGTDFLSPALEEADLMSRILSPKEFTRWFNSFLSQQGLSHLLELPVVSDRTDYQIVHLDGLCFSRSWCLQRIASFLPAADPRRKAMLKSATRHLAASLPNVVSGNYGGEHWLASFAVYALLHEL